MQDLDTNRKLSRILTNITPSNGTHAHADGLVEQTLITLTIVAKTRVNTITLNCSNLTQNVTIRTKLGGDTIDTLIQTPAMTAVDPKVLLRVGVVDETVTITMKSAIGEGAIRDVVWRVV